MWATYGTAPETSSQCPVLETDSISFHLDWRIDTVPGSTPIDRRHGVKQTGGVASPSRARRSRGCTSSPNASRIAPGRSAARLPGPSPAQVAPSIPLLRYSSPAHVSRETPRSQLGAPAASRFQARMPRGRPPRRHNAGTAPEECESTPPTPTSNGHPDTPHHAERRGLQSLTASHQRT